MVNTSKSTWYNHSYNIDYVYVVYISYNGIIIYT